MIIPCREYDPPGLWCAPCRAGRTDLCQDPRASLTPEQAQAVRQQIAIESEEYAERKRQNRWWRRALVSVQVPPSEMGDESARVGRMNSTKALAIAGGTGLAVFSVNEGGGIGWAGLITGALVALIGITND